MCGRFINVDPADLQDAFLNSLSRRNTRLLQYLSNPADTGATMTVKHSRFFVWGLLLG
jgi:hypothetical protein